MRLTAESRPETPSIEPSVRHVQRPTAADPSATAPLLERLVAGSRSVEDRMKRDWRQAAGGQVAARFCATRSGATRD